jgi:MFS family permease
MRDPTATPSGFRGPLAESYPAAVVLVLLALTPFLVLTSATFPLEDLIREGVGLSPTDMELSAGMANAAYCFGTVAAVQITQLLPARRMLVAFSSLFVVASIATAWAPTPGVFVAGHVTQGLAASLMLIAAAPPLVIGWPKRRLRPSAVTMNLGVFGAVALGPVIGGVFAADGSWRPLFWGVAALGIGALAMIVLTFEDQPPQNREAPLDLVSLALAAGGCGAAFLGASELGTHSLSSLSVLIPLCVGLGLILALLLHQFFVADPLMPVRRLVHTIPVAAILIAMCAGAASVGLVDLTETALQLQKVAPGHAGLLFLPEFGGAILTAAVFGAILFTRFVPALALTGLVVLGAGGLVLTGVAHGSDAMVLVGTAAIGVGVGASVSPALFATGFSLPSAQLPRIFALVELLRGVAAFLAGPLLLHIAKTVGATPGTGIEAAVWVATGIAFVGAITAVAIFASGGARLRRPDIDTWLDGEEPALPSPLLGARLPRVDDGL